MSDETEAQKKKRLAAEAKALAETVKDKKRVDLICISYHEDSDSEGNKVCYHKNDVIEGLTEQQAYALVQRKKAIYAPTETA